MGEPDEGDLPDHIVIAARAEDPRLIDATLGHLRALDPDVPITVISPSAQRRASTPVPNTAFVGIPAGDPSKGALINAFVAQGTLANGIVSIYDADSRPTSLRHKRLGSPVISQQLSVYTPPRRVGGGGWRTGFWSGCASNQSAWALGYERRSLRGRSFYLIGHGLTMDVSYLAETPFAEGVPGEDILLGYRMAMAGIDVAISPGVDVAEAPEALWEFLHQSGRWFMGEWCSLRAVTQHRGNPFVRLRLLGRRHVGLAFWAAGPPFVFACTVTGIRSRARWAWLALIVVRGARWAATERIERRHRPIPSNHLARFVGFNGKPLLASVGAFWAVVRYGLNDQLSAMPKART